MKRIADEELVREERAEESTQKWLQDAKFQEILGADSSHKVRKSIKSEFFALRNNKFHLKIIKINIFFQSLFVLLSHPDGSQGILLANKSPFSEEKSDIEKLLATAQLQEISRNDIFGSYNIEIDPKLNCNPHNLA